MGVPSKVKATRFLTIPTINPNKNVLLLWGISKMPVAAYRALRHAWRNANMPRQALYELPLFWGV